MKRSIGSAVVLAAFSAVQTVPAPERPRPALERRIDGARTLADFRDLAAAAGLTARTVIGGERTKQYILETTGGGVAILDYDNDGWPDIFLVNGARLAPSSTDAAPVSHLYRAGLAGTGWGRASVPVTMTMTVTSTYSSRITAIRFCIATTATARSAMSRVEAGCRCPLRAGIRDAPFSTSTATDGWTCSSRLTSITPMRHATHPGAAATAFGKDSA